MPDEATNGQQPPAQSAEEKFGNKLPKQIREQVDAVNDALTRGEQMDQGAIEDQQVDPGPEQPETGQQPPPSSLPEAPVEESWEQRARSAAGRLDQALNANSLLSRRIGELEQQIGLLRLNGTTAQPSTPPAPPPKPQLINPEERTDYGDEFFDVVGRRAREEFMPELDMLGERLKRLETGQQGIGQIIAKTQQRGVYEALHEEVPNWNEINHHPLFHQWLAFPDPYSGMQRHDLLKDAFARNDTNRVLAFFQGFLSEATGTPPEASGQEYAAPPLSNGQASERPSLEDFAAPGRARSAPQTLPPEKPVYSQAQIAKLSEEKRRGTWRGREAELEAIERDIFRAQHEGRIQP